MISHVARFDVRALVGDGLVARDVCLGHMHVRRRAVLVLPVRVVRGGVDVLRQRLAPGADEQSDEHIGQEPTHRRSLWKPPGHVNVTGCAHPDTRGSASRRSLLAPMVGLATSSIIARDGVCRVRSHPS
jgi:hypothetical protein